MQQSFCNFLGMPKKTWALPGVDYGLNPQTSGALKIVLTYHTNTNYTIPKTNRKKNLKIGLKIAPNSGKFMGKIPNSNPFFRCKNSNGC